MIFLGGLCGIVVHDDCEPAEPDEFEWAGMLLPGEDWRRVVAGAHNAYRMRETCSVVRRGIEAGEIPHRSARCAICTEEIDEFDEVAVVPLTG